MKYLAKTFGLTVLALSTLSAGMAGANASVVEEGQSQSWKYTNIVEVPNGRLLGKALHYAPEGKPGVIFWCRRNGGPLKSAIAMDDVDLLRVVGTPGGRMKSVKVTYKIGNTIGEKKRWLKAAHFDVVLPAKNIEHRKLYNAAVRGEAISIGTSRYGRIDIDFPERDREKFASFRRECNLGAKK